jgi:hypothetical protein
MATSDNSVGKRGISRETVSWNADEAIAKYGDWGQICTRVKQPCSLNRRPSVERLTPNGPTLIERVKGDTK